ncbi:hypothetical protein [Nocardia sp. NPDC052112]|uniref:hypothetical protein n=1 Tax=Nocardia sp. NPDC052112 TaxID=3155646 RepID=UPI003437CEFC
MTGNRAASGPIQPQHTSGGWRLEGNEHRWWLSKHRADVVAKVRATTARTCSWGIYTHEGRMIREASAGNDVEEAKAKADAWLRGGEQ